MSDSKQQPEPTAGEVWRHWQGGDYLVICRARDEWSRREVVVYQSLADDGIWVRHLGNWLMTITKAGGDKVPRFTRVEATPVPEPPAKEVPVAIHGNC